MRSRLVVALERALGVAQIPGQVAALHVADPLVRRGQLALERAVAVGLPGQGVEVAQRIAHQPSPAPASSPAGP